MSESDPVLITAIIPTFRRPDRLKKAIQSVLDQSYAFLQVCVYDNASGDETARIVSEFTKVDSRVKYYCHPRNIGAAENFQFGLLRVDTPFFSFLSDDDFLLPEFYATALQGFKEYPDAAFFSGAVIDITEKGEVVDIILSKWPQQQYYVPPHGLLEMIGKYSNWAGTLFRGEVIKKNGGIDVQLKAIDIDYVLRAAAHLPFTISKKHCAVFVQHSTSYSKNNGLKLIWPGWPVMISKIKENPFLSAETKKLAEQKLHCELQSLLLMNALRSLEEKQFDAASSIAAIFNQVITQKWKGYLLSAVVECSKVFPAFTKLLGGMMALRRFLLRRNKQSVFQKSMGF